MNGKIGANPGEERRECSGLPDFDAFSRRQRPVLDDGSPILGEAEGSPLYILVKEGERWIIAVGENTKIQTEAIVTQQKEISASDAK